MSLRVRERLGPADLLTLLNAIIGVAAMIAAVIGSPDLTARLILLAAVADALDGIVARRYGATAVGPVLDSVADVVSFGTAPAMFVFAVIYGAFAPLSGPLEYGLTLGVPACFVVFSILRTALYTVHVGADERRPGIQNTLGASILAAGYLAGFTGLLIIATATVILSLLMVAPIPYPKLRARDAFVMGVVQIGAIAQPTVLDRILPRILLIAALLYLVLAPRYYR
ncbi:MAG: protein sorting system archaetidylserine synthase [Salinirussus sp.]